MRKYSVLTLLSMLFVWVRPTVAASTTTVAIVWPPNPGAEVTEALTRVHGELLSVGLNPAKSDRPPSRGVQGADSRAWLQEVADQHDARAIIDVVGDDALLALDVWVVKKEPGRFEVTRVAVEPNSANPSERIALRAMDALRGSLLEIDWAAREWRAEPVAPPAQPAPVLVAAPAPPSHRLGLEVGATMLTSIDGVEPAFMPLVRLGWAARPWLLLQLSAAGLGSRPTVSSAAGQARVAQRFALLGGVVRWRSDKRLWPFVSFSAGVLHSSLSGRSGAGTQGHSLQQWSWLADTAVGTGLRLSSRTFATLAAHAQLAQPYVAIHIVDAEAASSGLPNFLFTLTLGAWL